MASLTTVLSPWLTNWLTDWLMKGNSNTLNFVSDESGIKKNCRSVRHPTMETIYNAWFLDRVQDCRFIISLQSPCRIFHLNTSLTESKLCCGIWRYLPSSVTLKWFMPQRVRIIIIAFSKSPLLYIVISWTNNTQTSYNFQNTVWTFGYSL